MTSSSTENQNGEQLARIAARRDFILRELATRPPSGKRVSEARSKQASKRSRGARGRYGPAAVAASAVIAQPATAIAVSATPVSVATTAAVAEPVAAAALAAFAVSVAPPRSQKEIQTMPAMTEQQVLSRLLQVSGNACGLRRKEAPPPAAAAEVEKASPPATLVMSLAERPQLHGLMLIPRDVDACRAIVAEQTERIARMVNGF